MYHDQGHVAAKMLGIWRGVNVTLGLPIVRTSVEHGTDFANAGTGLPMIGPSPDNPRLWYSLGYGGNGITLSAIAARLLVDAYLERPSPDAGIFAFDRPSLEEDLM